MSTVIQIAITTGGANKYDRLYVLLDDGTMWFADIYIWKRLEWQKIKEVPQEHQKCNESAL